MADEKTSGLRGGRIGRRDRWFGMESYDHFEAFRTWWHRIGKRASGRDLRTREEAIEAYQEFLAERQAAGR